MVNHSEWAKRAGKIVHANCDCRYCNPPKPRYMRILVENPDNNPININVYDLDRGGKLTQCLEVHTKITRNGIEGKIVLHGDNFKPCDIPEQGLSFNARVEFVEVTEYHYREEYT